MLYSILQWIMPWLKRNYDGVNDWKPAIISAVMFSIKDNEINIHTYTHTYTYTCMHTGTHTHTHTHTHTQARSGGAAQFLACREWKKPRVSSGPQHLHKKPAQHHGTKSLLFQWCVENVNILSLLSSLSLSSSSSWCKTIKMAKKPLGRNSNFCRVSSS